MDRANRILLLGAGFSRNWGGWLAEETLEYLLGHPDLDPSQRQLLWRHLKSGGFEGALAELQERYFRDRNATARDELARFERIVLQMFADMDKGFVDATFEFNNSIPYLVRTFLARFDAIFTLNQDLLLERHYLNENVQLGSSGKWNGWQIPGMRPTAQRTFGSSDANLGEWVPDAQPRIEPGLQPLIKLHGSSNWTQADGQRLLVLGGNKESIIAQFPVLKWNTETFCEYLARPRTRLMVVGYGFADDHITRMIKGAVRGKELGVFIVDPLGIRVLDRNRSAMIYTPGELLVELYDCVVGASRRTLSEIFRPDRVEHAKIMRFFSA